MQSLLAVFAEEQLEVNIEVLLALSADAQMCCSFLHTELTRPKIESSHLSAGWCHSRAGPVWQRGSYELHSRTHTEG